MAFLWQSRAKDSNATTFKGNVRTGWPYNKLARHAKIKVRKDAETGDAIALEFDEALIELFHKEPELRDEIRNYWEACHRFLYANKKYAPTGEALKLQSRITTQIPHLVHDYLSHYNAQTDVENKAELNEVMESIAHIAKDAEELRIHIMEPANLRQQLRHDLLQKKKHQDPFE